LFTGRAAVQRQTEDDHYSRFAIAEVKKMTIGDLSIRNMRVRVHDDGLYWSGNRRVRGILGRDVISDSLVYKFDRDKGMMYIGTQGNLKAPEGADKLSFTQSYDKHRRYLAKLEINRTHKLTVHLDLGARTSMLWSHLIKKYKMPNVPIQAELVDEYGTRRTVNSGTIAGIVRANEIETTALTMLPYADKRVDQEDLDGVLGLNFFNKYNITVNWHRKKFWMQPRNPNVLADATARVTRWGDQLTACETLACLRPTLLGRPDPVVAPEPPAVTEAAPGTEAALVDPEAAVGENGPVAVAGPSTDGGAVPSPAPMAIRPPVPVPEPVSAEAPTSYALRVERDAPGTGFAYDAVVGAVDDQGALLDLPVFLVSFPSGVNSLQLGGLAPDYGQAAAFVVLDINPVGTRGCEGSQCIFPLRNPQ
jgi:hypothetical protein